VAVEAAFNHSPFTPPDSGFSGFFYTQFTKLNFEGAKVVKSLSNKEFGQILFVKGVTRMWITWHVQ
jgi:hypothetical protein